MRDLDFGRQLIRYLEGLAWDAGVVVEDLSYAAPLVLHRLQELEPAQVILVGAVARDFDAPGSLRRYRLEANAPPPESVQRSLEESVQGVVDIDHTLAIARHYGALPAETVVIEVEPADCSFGPGFSEELAAAFDAILTMVWDEVGGGGEPVSHAVAQESPTHDSSSPESRPDASTPEPDDRLKRLIDYAHSHRQSRVLERYRAPDFRDGRFVHQDGLTAVGRRHPWGVKLTSGGDWYDVIPLEGGWVGCVIGDTGCRGAEGTAAMADLRAAVRAYAVADGHSPERMMTQLDRLARATGLGVGTTLVCIALRPSTGTLRIANAGHCPPLLLTAGHRGQYLRHATHEPLGLGPEVERQQESLTVARDSTLLLYTDGLVRSETQSQPDGLRHLLQTAAEAPAALDALDALCDHILSRRLAAMRRDDDISLLALRLSADPTERP